MKNQSSKNQIIHLKSVLGLAAMLGASLAAAGPQTNGSVVAWGYDYYGQTMVPSGLNDVSAIAAGGSHSLALKANGTVVAWGRNDYGQTNVPVGLNGALAIAAGGSHSLALMFDGTVVAWGAGGPGQSGNDNNGQSIVPASLSNVIAIAGGWTHSLALKSNGTVVSWGSNNYVQINVPAGLSNVIAIAGGGYHNLALRSDRTVVAWGAGGPGQSGYPHFGQSIVPAGLSDVIAIAAGGYHNLALKSDGTVVAWGWNIYGVTNWAAGLTGVIAIAAGGVSLALKSNGTVVAWGDNTWGQTNVPSDLYDPIAISAGGNFSLTIVVQPPRLKTLPVSQTVVAGFPAEFTVTALGNPPLFYQWFFNATNSIAGSTNASLQLPDVQLSQAGAYMVVVTNAVGSTSSPPAWLSVTAVPPTLTIQPASQGLWPGITVDFRVEATGSVPMAYQWFYNGTSPMIGETNSSLRLTNLQPWQAGTYSVIVTNAYGAATSTPAMLSLVPSNTVPITSEAVLRVALATGVNPVTFACDGTITLSSSIMIGADTILDGSGHQVTISGGNAVRVLYVSTNVALTLVNLTIANGWSTNGGGLYNAGGRLNATNCAFSGNVAQGQTNVPSGGGAIFNLGQANLQNCVFITNRFLGAAGAPGNSYPDVAPPGQDALGGAIHNRATLKADLCGFFQNSAVAGTGGHGWNGDINIHRDGTEGGMGGTAFGGAICNFGVLSVSRSTFTSNSIVGGPGGWGGDGGDEYLMGFPAGNGGVGGVGGAGKGAAVFNGGSASLVNSLITWNTNAGGAGGQGGHGGDAVQYGAYPGGGNGGGVGGPGLGTVCGTPFALVNCTIAWNIGRGGAGGDGGSGGGAYLPTRDPNGGGGPGGSGSNGSGGVIASGGSPSLVNCTLAFNSASGGNGGQGGYGSTIGPNGANGSMGGAVSGCALVNTLLAANTPGGNGSVTNTDLGHNLSSDGSCAFTNTGSLNNTDPLLGPLADNGGPTLTMALLPGSPAIDAGDNASAPPTDQRGFPRPLGAGADIGAYEYCYPAALRILPAQDGKVDITVYGISGQTCWLLTSTNLSDWRSIATNQIGADGTVLFQDNCGTGDTHRFYRVVIP